MERRNTIQKEMVLNAVLELKRHVTAEEVYEHVIRRHPSVGKGTIYRNLGVLVEEGKVRKVEVPDGPDRFDFTLKKHYHGTCVKCGDVFDVDMDEIPDIYGRINSNHGVSFLDYDIMFKGICSKCNR